MNIQFYPDELDYVNATLAHKDDQRGFEEIRNGLLRCRACNAEIECPISKPQFCPNCGSPDDKSFLGTFCHACLRADTENYELLRIVLHAMMNKYPAPPERLEAERRDRGAEGESIQTA